MKALPEPASVVLRTLRQQLGHVMLRLLLAGCAVLLPVLPAVAQESGGALKVGVYANPPYVIGNDDDDYSGIAIDLWRDVAQRLRRDWDWVEYKHLSELLADTAAGKVDVAVSNLTVTQARARQVTFTQPWLASGDRILIRSAEGRGLGQLWRGLRDAGFLWAYLLLAAIIAAATLVFTVFDRRFDAEFPSRWRDGLAESFYSVMSIATSGKPPELKNLFGWIGRIGQALWLVVGIAVFAFVTSTVTSVLTRVALVHQIQGLDDLGGKVIAVRAETVQEENARARGLNVKSYAHFEDMVAALLGEEVDAVIGNGPALEHHVKENPRQSLRVVGRLFDQQKYAFATAHDSALLRPLTLEVLGLVDAGRIDELKLRYLGADF